MTPSWITIPIAANAHVAPGDVIAFVTFNVRFGACFINLVALSTARLISSVGSGA